MRLVFLGAPGVGKGTQADKAAVQYHIHKISTGDLLREAVRNKTTLGLEAKEHMDQGRLVPDSVVIGLVREKLADQSHADGFILDGFPRTIPQAESLAKVLAGGELAHRTTVTEDYLLDLERDAFLKLCGERKTLERIQHTLKTGKPLRN